MKSELKFSGSQRIQLEDGVYVRLDQWVQAVFGVVEFRLIDKIKELNGGDSSKQLSQENIACLLIYVEEQMNLRMTCTSFFLADYFLDRKEALSSLRSKAGYHYRKSFQLGDGSTSIKEL